MRPIAVFALVVLLAAPALAQEKQCFDALYGYDETGNYAITGYQIYDCTTPEEGTSYYQLGALVTVQTVYEASYDIAQACKAKNPRACRKCLDDWFTKYSKMVDLMRATKLIDAGTSVQMKHTQRGFRDELKLGCE